MRVALVVLAALCGACASHAAGDALPLELKGEWRQGSLIFGRTDPAAAVRFNGRTVRLAKDGTFVVGLDRDEPARAELLVTRDDGARVQRVFTVEPRTYDVQRIDGLPPAQVTPPPEVQARIAEDIRRTRQARMRDSAHTDFANGFIWPCHGRISGVFGSQRILNGVPKQPHYGVDVAAPPGTIVRAPAGGIVSLAATDMYYTGGTLMIDHGHGVSSTFLHLQKILVKEGDVVRQGDPVAHVGATGRVTGPHLDWRMNWFDVRVDPQLLVGPMPGEVTTPPR